MEENKLLNNEELIKREEEVIETLKEEQNTEDTTTIKDLYGGNMPEDFDKVIEESKEEYKDGVPVMVSTDPDTNASSIMEIPDYLADVEIPNLDSVFSEDKFRMEDADYKTLVESGLSEDAAQAIFKLILEYDKNPNMTNVYDKLPAEVQKLIMIGIEDPQFKSDHRAKEMMAKEMLMSFKNELMFDQNVIDFQTMINKEYSDMSTKLGELALDNIREKMEVSMLEHANKLAEDPEKLPFANRLREISALYTTTYKFTKLIKKIENKSKKIVLRDLNKDLKDYDKIIKKFNSKYSHSKFSIPNINLILQTLATRVGVKYTLDDLKRFVLLFCSTTKGLDSNDPYDHVYMYYTILNIVTIDQMVLGQENEFAKEVLNNVKVVLDMLK